MTPVLTVRLDPLAYPAWRTWRTMRRDPHRIEARVEESVCGTCMGNRWTFHAVPLRHPDPDRMALLGPGRPHLLPVLCAPCGGEGRLARIVAVEVGPTGGAA